MSMDAIEDEIYPSFVFLPVLDLKQEQSEWCWAATTMNIVHFYNADNQWTQCSLVNRALSRHDCCDDSSGSDLQVCTDCNKPGYPDHALEWTGHYKSIVAGKPSLGLLMSELSRQRPVSIAIHWRTGGYHNVAIIGYDNSDPLRPTIDIADPLFGPSTCDFQSFPENYIGRHAIWIRSYLTIQ